MQMLAGLVAGVVVCLYMYACTRALLYAHVMCEVVREHWPLVVSGRSHVVSTPAHVQVVQPGCPVYGSVLQVVPTVV
jgi:hypothetical protein